MSWGMVAGAAATVVGGAMSSSASKKAAKSQSKSAQAGIESEERMFDKQLALQEPYREAGYQALSGLQGLTTPEGRATALSDYYLSDEFAGLRGQEEERQLRMGAATGNTRGGAIQPGLASITPGLGQSYLSNQYNQLTGLANMGFGASSQGVQGAQNLGMQTSQLLGQQGQAQAANQLAQANIWGNTVGTLGGMAQNYFNQPQPSGNRYSDGSLI